MPRPPSQWFMRSASGQEGEDSYTRNTSPRTRPVPQSSQQPQQQQRSRRRLSMASTIFTISPGANRPSFPAVFNIVRFSIYAAVLCWAVICLAIAVHFNGLLQSSDLTAFIPLAIFVSIATILIFVVLLGFTLWKRDANPISARIELGCLGLAGTLWIALGALMASSDADMAEVECYASEDDTEPVELPGFTTDTFRAQYRVLEAFSLFNAILIWAFFLFLLFLILRRRSQGNHAVWFHPVTDLPYADLSGKNDKLPAPVTARSRSHSRPSPPEKQQSYNKGTPSSTPATSPGSTPRGGEAGVLWMPHVPRQGAATTPNGGAYAARPPARPGRAYPGSYDKYRRDASPRRDTSQQRSRSQSADRLGPRREDSQRSQQSNTDRYGRTPQREDSQRTYRSAAEGRAPQRGDSQRTYTSAADRRVPSREDSRRTQRSQTAPAARAPSREDSRRTQQSTATRGRGPNREDSQRSQQSAYKYARTPGRENSQRSQDRYGPSRGDSQRSGRSTDRYGTGMRREDSQRSADKWGRDASPRRR